MTIRGRITEKTVLKLQAVGVGVAFHHTDPLTGAPVHTLTNQKQGAKNETTQKISAVAGTGNDCSGLVYRGGGIDGGVGAVLGAADRSPSPARLGVYPLGATAACQGDSGDTTHN